MNEKRKEVLSDMLSSLTGGEIDHARKVIEICDDIPKTLSKLIDKINTQQQEIERLENRERELLERCETLRKACNTIKR